MVDAVVTVFLERLLNTLVEEGRVVHEFRDQFEKLQDELQLMQCFLKDADKQKRKNQTLHGIMAKLRELIYESEDILADCQLQSREDNQFSNGCLARIYPPNLHFQNQTGKRLRKINEKITDIKQSIMSYLGPSITNDMGRIDACNDQMPRWSSPVYDHTQVVGLEDDTKKIKDWLYNADVGILKIGIVGMGGLGKTTIAQMVFNDREIEDRFERRMWISVSQSFDEEQIMRSMLRTLGDASVGDDRGELLRKINQYLLGKRYLIVMDDVWSLDGNWWSRISEGLPKGNGSSVIITTRLVEVLRKMEVSEARTHQPDILNGNNSWLLFRKIAFAASGGDCTKPELEKIGKEIVQKCNGLPLAIKAIGGMLLYKSHYHEWKRIADNFRDELGENDDTVMPSLQLSYDELPPYLKSCFLSFSLYPEDCVVTKEQLVHWWIGEGFVPLRSGRPSTEAGEDCFSGLTNRCLVEVVEKTYNGAILTCKIHDMVRELVIKMAENEAFFKVTGRGCRHFGIDTKMDPKQLAANHKLRALLSTTKTGEVNKISSSIANKFSECKYLRVLDLCKSIFEKLGLHLVWVDEIGDSEVSALVNLQQLQFLTISCFDSHGSGLVDKLDKLYPPPELHELCLQFYPGKLSPAWLNPISLHMLRYLWISSGNLAMMDEAFFGENNSAWEIEGLMLESLSDLEMEWKMVQQVMPSLKIVNASWCPNLVSFPIEDVGFRGGVWAKGENRR